MKSLLSLAVVVVATLVAFLHVPSNGFVNWDDPEVIVSNARLVEPGVVRWAFTTTHMDHYQPLSWLAWAVTRRVGGPDPAAFHAVALAGHAINTALVFALAMVMLDRGTGTRTRLPSDRKAQTRARSSVKRRGLEEARARIQQAARWTLSSGEIRAGTLVRSYGAEQLVAASAAALLFGIHPLRVEPVAWASAMPYVAGFTLLCASCLAYAGWSLSAAPGTAGGLPAADWRWLALAVGFYSLAGLVRPIAPAFVLALVALDLWLHGRAEARRDRSARVPAYGVAIPGRAEARRHERPRGAALQTWLTILKPRLAPLSLFAVVGLAGVLAEVRARDLATLAEVGPAARLQLAASAPFVYAWRTLWPVGLSPLDVLPLEPSGSPPIAAAAVLAFAAGCVLAVGVWRRHPFALAAWLAWIALLAPAILIGLLPSGLQETADRYTYAAGAVPALVAGAALGYWRRRQSGVAWTVALAACLSLGVLTWRQASWWRDSVALWGRAVDLDPRNDVALYNLGAALAEAGREREAADRYRQVLAAIPDHALARRNLSLLEATGYQRDADRLAGEGELDEAVILYSRVLAIDPKRARARAGRGMARASQGALADALPDLEQAFAEGIVDPALASALAFGLVRAGRQPDARKVLERALAGHPDDVGLTHNLARLLATSSAEAVRDPPRAVSLAERATEATAGRDPRILDTLAAAYAAAGRVDEARETAEKAVERAMSAGDTALAAEIRRRAAALGGKPRGGDAPRQSPAR